MLLMAAVTPGLASAIQPGMPLLVEQESIAIAYSVPTENACLILDTDGGFDDSDLSSIKTLISDIEVSAGPGVFSEAQAEGNLIYTYGLVPELRGTKLIYRGLMPSDRLTGVKISSKSGKALIDVISHNFAHKSRVDFVYSERCGS